MGYSQDSIVVNKKDSLLEQIPFERILKLSNQEMLMSGFDFEVYKNRYVTTAKFLPLEGFKFIDMKPRDLSRDFEICIYMGGDNKNVSEKDRRFVQLSWESIFPDLDNSTSKIVSGSSKDIKSEGKKRTSGRKERLKNEEKVNKVVYDLKEETKKAIMQITFRDSNLYEKLISWMNSVDKSPFIAIAEANTLMEVEHGKYRIRIMKQLHKANRSISDEGYNSIACTVSDLSFITPLEDYETKSSKDYTPIYIFTVFTENSHNSYWLNAVQVEYLKGKNQIQSLEDML